MSAQGVRTRIRTALSGFPERYALPSRPSAASPTIQDAFRQTQFMLSADLDLFERVMNLQLQILSANSKLRSPEAAALLAFWSRAFTHSADACTLMSLGSYSSCAPVLRAACDCIAAQHSLLAEGFSEYHAWLEGALSLDRERAAMAFDLGRFRAGSALAEDEQLSSVYRLLTDLSMPHFGSTALQVAPDSNLQKLAISFSDSAFHLGWAELIAGWLLILADAQLTTVVSSRVVAVEHAALAVYQSLSREIADALASRRRCYVEEVGRRFLLHNYRRTAAGSPKRVLL